MSDTERRIRAKLTTHPTGAWALVEAFDAICAERRALAAQLAEAQETAEGAANQAEKWRAQLAERERALNGFRWLANNRHNYGSQKWLEFFDAAMEDAFVATHSDSEERE